MRIVSCSIFAALLFRRLRSPRLTPSMASASLTKKLPSESSRSLTNWFDSRKHYAANLRLRSMYPLFPILFGWEPSVSTILDPEHQADRMDQTAAWFDKYLK